MLNYSDFEMSPDHSVTTEKGVYVAELAGDNVKKCNEAAVSTISKEYVDPLYGYGMHMCRNHYMVMECLQDLYLKLWRKSENIPDIRSVKRYLFKSFRGLLIRRIIEHRKSITVLQEHEIFELEIAIDSGPIGSETGSARTNRLVTGVLSLTRDQREVIYLKLYNRLTYSEIAEITGLQIDSVRELAAKALELVCKKVQVVNYPVSVL
jgi:RNA polymerase sigma factor (sigma-70 family)